ncbi:MAG TPA: carbohydrate ABC transporter permease [Spirochaetia bacterium]|nr:carbohydrate ABC transporter permease [Spirochaetia bacterium]
MFSRRRFFSKIFLYVVVIIVLVVTLFPFYWIINMSLQNNIELYHIPPYFFPPKPTMINFTSVLFEERGNMKFYEAVYNTLYVALISMVVCVTFGSITGYALARLKWKAGKYLLFILIGTQMVPPFTDLIPIYIIFSRYLHIIDTKLSLIISYTGWLLPISVWILYGYFQTIPINLEDAARIDGCTRLKALSRVVLPLSAPGVAATAIFSFISATNEFLFAMIFTSTVRSKTVPVALSDMIGKYQIQYGDMTAGAVIAALLPVILALAFQKYLVQSLTAGGVKG